MTQPPPANNPIDRNGKYVLGALLGIGGMAEVYRGHTTGAQGFERKVAIKRVLAPFSANAAFVEMFTNEARLAAMLNHPCVVAVHDYDVDLEGRLFQVIEYVDGVDLEKLISSDPRFSAATDPSQPPPPSPVLPYDIASYILGEVLEGLHHAHTAKNHVGRLLGIVHRDCTPSNVLLSWDGAVKLSDFGVAKAMQATNATQSGSAKGKPAYMAPEQLHGAADMDARADLFAVGVMLYELLTGRRPFTGDSVQALILAVADYGRGELVVPSAFDVTHGAVPEALSRLAARLIARNPVDRPPSAKAALMELHHGYPPAQRTALALLLARRWHNKAPRSEAELLTPLHNLPTNVAAARAGAAAASRATIGQTPPPLGDLAPPQAPRRRGLAIALASGVIVLGTAIAVAVTPSGNAPSIPAAGRDPDDASPPIVAPATATDAPLPDDAAPPIDAGVDAAGAMVSPAITPDPAGPPPSDAAGPPPPAGHRRTRPPPPPRGPLIEKSI